MKNSSNCIASIFLWLFLKTNAEFCSTMSGTEEFSLLLSFFNFSKSKIERRSVGEDRHYEFLTSPMDYSTVASEDRTSEWILTEGGQKQINSGNLMYQKWAANAAQNMTAAGMMTSKLNPECKPFSPTRKYNKQGKVSLSVPMHSIQS